MMMSISQIVRIVRGRARLFLAISLGVTALVAVASLLAPKEFVAEAALVLDPRGDDPLNDRSLAPQLAPAHLATQAEIIRSRNVALKVVEDLQLHNDPEITAGAQKASDANARTLLADGLLQSLEAKTSRNSNIIRLAFTSDDPAKAAAIANGFADAYIRTSLQLKVDPARRQATWFDEQVQQLREELVAAQAKLAKHQSDNGVLGVDDARIDVENARLEELSNQLVKAQSAMYDADTRRGVTSNASAQLPDLMSNPLLQNLKSELARAESKFAELSERYGVNHPQYRSAAAEVEALRSQLNAQISAARGSLDQGAGIAQRQVAELQKALAEQKNRIIELNQERDELTVLNRDVESAREAYDAGLRKANETRLESRVDRTNVAILNPATAPLWPSSPRIALNTVVALLAGIALALGVILTAELFNRRLRSSEDLFEYAELLVLAELPALPAQRRRVEDRTRRQALPLRATPA